MSGLKTRKVHTSTSSKEGELRGVYCTAKCLNNAAKECLFSIRWWYNTTTHFSDVTIIIMYTTVSHFRCCASYVGRQTTHLQQGLSLGDACMNRFSTLLHELGHVIGFWHEQSRPDRDEYISVLRGNIMPGTANNFKIEEQINSMGIGYDYNSIMHYSSTAFGGGRTTLQAHDTSIPIGGAVNLSELDIMQANLLYQCGTFCLQEIIYLWVYLLTQQSPMTMLCLQALII